MAKYHEMILGNEQDSVLHHTYSYTIDFNPLLFPDLVLGLQTVHHITRRNQSESHKSCNSAYNDGSGGNISDMSTIVPYGLKSVGHCSLRTSRRKVGLGAKKNKMATSLKIFRLECWFIYDLIKYVQSWK